VRRGAILLLFSVAGCGGSQLAWYGRTPDRARAVEVRQSGDRQWLVVDGHASRAYRFVAAHDLAFDATGRRVAFAAETSEAPEKWVVVADFVEGRAWDAVAGLRFGPRGTRFAYAALDGERWQWIVDGVPQRPFDEVDPDSVTFSPDGRRVGYVASDGACHRTVIDAALGPCNPRVVALSLADDARRDVRLVADEGDGTDGHLFVGQERVLDVPRALGLEVDTGATRWAVRAQGDRGVFVVVDGVRGAPHADVEPPVFSANGAHVGYVAHDGARSVVVVDDRVVDEQDAPITALAFSDDGTHAGWFYRVGAMSGVAVDGHRFPFEVVVERTLHFSRDGRHWAALVGSRTDRRLFITVDGGASLPVDSQEIFDPGAGDPGTRLSTLVAGELDRYLARTRGEGS
jgi:hypothetical protein